MSSPALPETDSQPASDHPDQARNANQGNDGPRWTDKVQAAAAVTGVIGLVWGLAVGIQTLNAGIEDTRLEQRAWVGPTGFDVQLEIGKPLIVDMTIRNFGRTPARNLVGHVIFDPIDKGASPSFDYTKEESLTVAWMLPNAEQHANKILSHSTKDRSVISSLTPELFDRIARGETRLTAHGRFEYQDIFGDGHWVQWFFQYHPDTNTWSMVNSAHNGLGTNGRND